MSVTELFEPVLTGGIRDTHFFGGRMLAAGDLRTLQEAGAAHRARLGRVAGAGVAFGLDVRAATAGEGASEARPLLHVSPGAAVTRAGAVVELTAAVKVALVRDGDSAAGAAAAGYFAPCPPPPAAAAPTNPGLYLLAILPAHGFEGRAPMVEPGSDGVGTGCGHRFAVDGVRFRLLRLSLPGDGATGGLGARVAALAGELEPLLAAAARPGAAAGLRRDAACAVSRLRNGVAHLCFGTEEAAAFAARPFDGAALAEYGLLDRLWAARTLGDDEVPLALVCWSAAGLRFVDPWAVRRLLAPLPPGQTWPLAASPRRLAEGVAALQQFQRQLADLAAEDPGALAKVTAADWFFYLPPAGFFPLGAGGVDPGTFFQGRTTHGFLQHLEGSRLEATVRVALEHPPIDLRRRELIWTYLTRENQQAAGPRFLLFANGQIPFQGASQYDLAYWNYANYA